MPGTIILDGSFYNAIPQFREFCHWLPLGLVECLAVMCLIPEEQRHSAVAGRHSAVAGSWPSVTGSLAKQDAIEALEGVHATRMSLGLGNTQHSPPGDWLGKGGLTTSLSSILCRMTTHKTHAMLNLCARIGLFQPGGGDCDGGTDAPEVRPLPRHHSLPHATVSHPHQHYCTGHPIWNSQSERRERCTARWANGGCIDSPTQLTESP